MKPFIVVIGGTEAGKSTIITSLTGCKSHNSSRTIVTDKVNGEKIYVIASSPQEDQDFVLRNLNTAFRNVKNNQNIIGLVMAIQPNKPTIRISLETIIQHAQDTNFLDIYTFVLDPPYNGKSIDRTSLRVRLRKFGIVPHYLDARHFALLNALKIRRATGIP